MPELAANLGVSGVYVAVMVLSPIPSELASSTVRYALPQGKAEVSASEPLENVTEPESTKARLELGVTVAVSIT